VSTHSHEAAEQIWTDLVDQFSLRFFALRSPRLREQFLLSAIRLPLKWFQMATRNVSRRDAENAKKGTDKD
jgi:hypothetical protein